ncbi:hypothetical protein CRG49_008700 [Neisseria sp. N95_16]|uniref:Uncharacterized protein n=1 Tax=Neisseria brasiliensis TaxID=2666100 RepID=A0A7X2GWE7_9NEIS|nr:MULTISPECIES: hypothetical protein [Neisseria]MRN37223.1 hypothetical protein [Neisseria brasiliensis]PJO09226.1 hypothetical protein CRG49_008700 [Neisseria sp. N95_16]
MTLNQEFEELLDSIKHGDTEELHDIFMQEKQLLVLFNCAQTVLAKYPDGLNALRSMIALAAAQTTNSEQGIIFELALENYDNGLFSPNPQASSPEQCA